MVAAVSLVAERLHHRREGILIAIAQTGLRFDGRVEATTSLPFLRRATRSHKQDAVSIRDLLANSAYQFTLRISRPDVIVSGLISSFPACDQRGLPQEFRSLQTVTSIISLTLS